MKHLLTAPAWQSQLRSTNQYAKKALWQSHLKNHTLSVQVEYARCNLAKPWQSLRTRFHVVSDSFRTRFRLLHLAQREDGCKHNSDIRRYRLLLSRFLLVWGAPSCCTAKSQPVRYSDRIDSICWQNDRSLMLSSVQPLQAPSRT